MSLLICIAKLALPPRGQATKIETNFNAIDYLVMLIVVSYKQD